MADVLTKSLLKQIESQRKKVGGARVVTDDINKLKGLSINPEIPKDDIINYYREPVTIEYYIPKESRFAYELKNLYVKLYDPAPRNERQQEVMGYYIERREPIDIVNVMDRFPKHLTFLLHYYSPYMHLHEAFSREVKTGIEEDSVASMKRALYLTEVLHKYEPTVPALEILGDYTTYNLNWFIRELNRHDEVIELEDPTVHYLINRNISQADQNGERLGERFYILKDIYLEQAFSDPDDPFDDDEI